MSAKTVIACGNNFTFGLFKAYVAVSIDWLSTGLWEPLIVLMWKHFCYDVFGNGYETKEFYQHDSDQSEKWKWCKGKEDNNVEKHLLPI